jgi:hypothetical protein
MQIPSQSAAFLFTGSNEPHARGSQMFVRAL